MINQLSELYGRQISQINIDPDLLKSDRVVKRPAIEVKNGQAICQRCGSRLDPKTARLPRHQYYCPICINLGRVSTLNPLCTVKEPNQFRALKEPMSWNGHLTKEQAKCSAEIIQGFKQHQSRLLWAVTGAGKTEMLFPGLRWALKRGYRIGIASPRVDVCLELYPRIRAAFNQIPIALLHGRSKQKYHYTQLVICTTHQLLRFYHAFDLLIIDEVDAFPFAGNAPLQFAVGHAVKSRSSRLFLTATPNQSLLKRVHQGKLAVSYLPIRFHRHLLPEIHCHIAFHWRWKLPKGKLPKLMLRLICRDLNQHLRFLLFVPHIRDLWPVSRILKRYFSPKLWRTVYSQDPQRLKKVQMMRQKKVKFLITTTILERGVTFPGIDVIILGADDEVFSVSSLVQIAGRVGRKRDRPTGNVDFFIASYTKRVVDAQNQIKHMNYLGAKLL